MLKPQLDKIPHAWFESIQQKAIRGTPDIMGCIGKYFIALEVKTDEGTTTTLQEYKLNKIRTAGGNAIVVSPKNAADVLDFLNKLSMRVTEEKNGSRAS